MFQLWLLYSAPCLQLWACGTRTALGLKKTWCKVKHMVILLFIFYSCKYLFYVLQCLTCFLAWYLNDYYQEWPLYWLGGSYLHIIQHEDKEYSKWCQEISSRKNVRIFVCSNFFLLELFSWPRLKSYCYSFSLPLKWKEFQKYVWPFWG